MMRYVAYLVVLMSLLSAGSSLWADLLPPGHKTVNHQIVFEPSAALASHQIVAAPIAGFSGEKVVCANEPFRFSSKYGTRFYVIPASVQPLPQFDRDAYSQWSSAEPPKGEIRSVSKLSPIASARTTLKLIAVTERGPVVEMVKHEEFDRRGNLITAAQRRQQAILMGLLVVVGLSLCCVLIRRTMQSGMRAQTHAG